MISENFQLPQNENLLEKSDRGKEFFESVFQNFLKVQNIRQYSGYTDKKTSIAERILKTIRNSLKKSVFLGRKR